MVRRETVLRLVREGHTYPEAADRLGIAPGLAYLVATGIPTDSTDGFSQQELQRPGLLSHAQVLSNPRLEEPDRSAHVREFLSRRAEGDEQMQAAGKSSAGSSS